ncbi:hypothetical protein ACOMHN_063309 [Nucella lapillus]
MKKLARLFAVCVVVSLPAVYFLAPHRRARHAWHQVFSRPAVESTAGDRKPQPWYQGPRGHGWRPGKLLIFTYPRSGSSLTGAIVRHSPDVFFTFEPLAYLGNEGGPQRRLRGRELLQAIYHCNFSTSAITPLAHNLLMTRYPETTLILRCFQFLIRGMTQVARLCFKAAEGLCNSLRFHSIKVIRMSMDEVGDLMTLNPDLAVIFLVRDPRASMWSSMTVFKTPTLDSLQPTVANYCRTMDHDLALSQRLFRLHPHRLRYLRYEDLAKRPLKVSFNIYHFLRLNWTSEVARRVKYQTSNNPKTGTNGRTSVKHVPFFQRNNSGQFHMYSYSVQRENASVAAALWKTDIPLSVVRTVQNECSHVLTLLGYRRIDSLQDIGQYNVHADTLGFKLAESLPFRGDLNY